MKPYLLISILFLLNFSFCQEAKKEIKTSFPIKLTITNDYLSERSFHLPPPPPKDIFDSKLIDSLRSCYVEYYENNEIVKKKYYNSIGLIYKTIYMEYDEKKRIHDKLVIYEWEKDSIRFSYIYKDSLTYKLENQIVKQNNKNIDFIKIKYKFNSENNIYKTIWENGVLSLEEQIFYPNENEKQIIEIDKIKNRKKNITLRFNENDEIIYEKEICTSIKNEELISFKEYEYVYKYDQKNNWIERTKQSIERNGRRPSIGEKLIRKIYY